MKTNLPLQILSIMLVVLTASCARRNYATPYFEQQASRHRIIAILPAEMIFTGVQPKNISPEEIEKIEEAESRAFQISLFNGIMRHANTRRYASYVSVQDISTTWNILEENQISIRDSWKEDDRRLAELLGVDAVVRMRVQKKRYMSDLASLGVTMGRQVLSQIGNAARFPVPYVSAKTSDLFVSCNIVSNNQTLWNDHYKGSTSYNRPSEEVIDNITDHFGRNFPYRQRR